MANDGGTVYRAPNTVACLACGAQPGEPCRRLETGSPLDHWHSAREHVAVVGEDDASLTLLEEDDVLQLLPAVLTVEPQPELPAQPQGTVARRHHLDTELREYARQLLQLEAGALATGPTAFTDLEAALDYLMTLVQDGTR